ncbi:MAG: sigma-70 family RNA polymerase sigma factor [bacterium]|nr:sigma-70 family RNA polymerase sigma factor [bacterium]
MNKEEINLLLKKYYITREKAYRNKVVEIMLPYVKYLAYKNSNISEIDDSIQNGVIGLIKAIENFDFKKSDNFISFASLYITGEIKKYYRDFHNLVRPPREIYENQSVINQKIRELTQKLKRPPTLKELEEYTQINKEKLIEHMEFSKQKQFSLENSTLGNEKKISEIISDKKNVIEEVDRKMSLQEAISKLDPLEKTVITLKFFEGLTQEEIAKKLNTIQVNVSRIQSKALKKLKETIISN